MNEPGEISPYGRYADQIGPMLADPQINAFEHTVAWPRFQIMLPKNKLFMPVRRVLDFGCGPGNFTEDLARRYPKAEVLGVDAEPAILPAESPLPNLSFRQWNGQTALDEEPFDLVTAKMVFHYLSAGELDTALTNIWAVMNKDATLAMSLPSTEESGRFVGGPSKPEALIRRQIGRTGIFGLMYHRPAMLASLVKHIPHSHTLAMIGVRNDEGGEERTNIAILPRGRRFCQMMRRSMDAGIRINSVAEAERNNNLMMSMLRDAFDHSED
jgi:SAM-dependent methyltransferase